MAPQRVLKSLNKGPGKKRFVFKSFSQRVEEVDVDVFRSLAPVKFEPTSGSSFFHENLLRWRELNAAADFNDLYVELLPIVQTLPQLLVHKDAIIKSLLSRVRLSALLSLEPILSLIALLSRDLREEFLPYMPKFVEVCSELLRTGGDQEPELLEQVFVSISHVIKYLTKFLAKDILFVLRVTKSLRYDHRTFVQDFVAESVSYLLRKAPPKQLIKGVRRLFAEAEADPCESNISSCCTLLFHTLKGPAFGLHSQAASLLHLLLDRSTLSGVQQKGQGDGGKVAVQLVSKTFLMLCEHIKRDKLEVLWDCLLDHISGTLSGDSSTSLPQPDPEAVTKDLAKSVPQDEPLANGHSMAPGLNAEDDTGHSSLDMCLSDSSGPGPSTNMVEETVVQRNEAQGRDDQIHLVHLLSLLTDVLEFRTGSRVNDYKPLFAVVPRLLHPELLTAKSLEFELPIPGPIAPARLFNDWASEFSAGALRFLLALLKSHAQVAGASGGPRTIAAVAPTWAVAFNCNRVNCLLQFLRGLIEQDVALIRIFVPEILRSLDLLIEDYPVDVLPLLLDASQKLELGGFQLSFSNTKCLKSYVIRLIQESMKRFERGSIFHYGSDNVDYIGSLAEDPAVVWMALKSLPYIVGAGEKHASLAWEYATSVEGFLSSDQEFAARQESDENSSTVWECLIATGLSSHIQVLRKGRQQAIEQFVDQYLPLALAHRKSSHVLKSVGDLLDASAKERNVEDGEDTSKRVVSFLEDCGPNLSAPDKSLRTMTLRILSYYESVQMSRQGDQSPSKRQKLDNGQQEKSGDTSSYELFRQLLAVESSVLSHENFRQSCLLINTVKVTACTRKIPGWYVVPLFKAFIGVLHNRFSLLWDSAMEAIAGMVEVHGNTVGQVLLSHLEVTQNAFLCRGDIDRKEEPTEEDLESAPKDLWARFESYSVNEFENSTRTGTLLTLQLRILQKVANFSEARSRQLIPLFLKFVGHSDSPEDHPVVVVAHGRDWKAGLKEWLNLIKEMRNARSFFRGSVVKEILLNRFLSDSDPAIQQVTLEVLLNWKDKYLTDYKEHLENLISSKALREKLTTWDVSKESCLIQVEDREPLLTAVLLILFPKIMRRTVKSMGKSGVRVQRNAVLSFLARLESKELAPLFIQLMKPLDSAFTEPHSPGNSHPGSKTVWMCMIVKGVVSPEFIKVVDTTSIGALPYKRKLGFLHMVLDSLEIFNSTQLTPYLFALLAVVLRLLETCSFTNTDVKGTDIIIISQDCDANPSAAESHADLPVIEVGNPSGEVCTVLELPGADSIEEKDHPAICYGENEEVFVLGTVQLGASEADDEIGRDAGPPPTETEGNLQRPEPGLPNSDEAMILDEEPTSIEFKQEDDDRPLEDLDVTIPKTRGAGVREIRTLCFRVIATVIRKFENLDFPPIYWDIFFDAIKQTISQFAAENSFTGTPSALMQCFMALSNRVELAPLLARDPALVPNILSILAVKGASPEVVSSVLNFIENILDLIGQSEEHDHNLSSSVRAVLLPHLDVLLLRFGDCLSFHRESSSERRSLKRELRILTRLSKYIGDSPVAVKLQDVLLPMLKVKKRMELEMCLEVLHLLQRIGPILQITRVNKCLPVLAPLLVSVSNKDVRGAVSETLVALGNVDVTLVPVAELLADLNAMSTNIVDEFDYSRRLDAYDQMSAGSLFPDMPWAQALLVLSHAIYDMGSEDMSIRHRASDCLQKYVQFAATLPEEDINGEEVVRHGSKGTPPYHPGGFSVASSDMMIVEAFGDDEEQEAKPVTKSSKSLVPNFLLPHIRNAMASDLLVVRREWVLLLREMAANFSSDSALKEYQCLISKDMEADFFHNIVHLQVHRRIKAMMKFKVICASSSHFSQGALLRIFVPLFMNSLFEARGDKEGNLVTVAVETLACIATQLLWEPYFGLLMRSFRLLSSKPDHQKVLVRLVCAILDTFHFFVLPPNENEEEKGHPETTIGNVDSGNSIGLPALEAEGQLTSQGITSLRLAPEVLGLLRKRVLPEIRQVMVSKAGIVSTPVALTQVKILKLMTEKIIEVELPQVIRTVINALKSRSQAVRDEARAALVAIAQTLGANYLHFIVEVLQSSLTKGFELHVLGYTLNSILVKLVPNLKVGEIDYCLKQILEVLERDILGEVAEEKDVEAIAVKMKETKHMRSFESMRLLAQVVTFRTQITALLGPVQRNLRKSLAFKVKPKLENILQEIALGLLHNKSVTQSDLLVIVYAMVEDGVKEEQAIVLAAAAKKQARIDRLASVNISSEAANVAEMSKAPVPHFYLIIEFALQLLHNHLKRAKVKPSDIDTLTMLNPLVGLLQECLNTKYDGVLAITLKNFGLLLLLPLPAIDLYGDKITTLVFTICQRFSKSENPLLQACVNVLIILIRQCRSSRLSEDQLRTLLQFPIFVDLEGSSRMALSLLKSIVSRKLLVPELYDMMNRVAQLMVTSYAAPVRQLCSQILLQFLLDYLLGKKRLQQHLDFFITNVGYAQSTGREAALEMLYTVILKFPDTVVEEHADSMFFPLVTRLVNEESNQVRSMIGTILKVLMGHVGPRSLQRIVDFSMSWYKGADKRLWRAAAQVLGFVIEVKGPSFGRYTSDVLPRCIQILEQANNSPHEDEGFESDATVTTSVSWQDAYFSLTMMEKLLQKLPNMILLPDLKVFWVSVSSLLLHQHIWIRKVCGRLLSFYFTACGVPSCQGLESAALGKGDNLLLHPSWILLLVASLCQQLDSGSIDDAMGNQLVAILEVISTLLPLLPQNMSMKSSPEKLSFLGCDDVESQLRLSRALHLLGWKDRSQRAGADVLSKTGKLNPIEDIENDGHDLSVGDELTNASALFLVFKKLQRIALRVDAIQTKVILRWYAAMATRLGANDIEKYLKSILIVLTKISEGSAAKVVPEDVKKLGDEVLNQLREQIGVAKFVNMYNTVRERGKENRDKRKQAQKISALVDPERNAKRKIKMLAKRQAQKKRKIIKGKVQMGL